LGIVIPHATAIKRIRFPYLASGLQTTKYGEFTTEIVISILEWLICKTLYSYGNLVEVCKKIIDSKN
jgi:hypothetical protein